jgi:hypothetical protein
VKVNNGHYNISALNGVLSLDHNLLCTSLCSTVLVATVASKRQASSNANVANLNFDFGGVDSGHSFGGVDSGNSFGYRRLSLFSDSVLTSRADVL